MASCYCDLCIHRYANLLDLTNQRWENLRESCKAYQLVREAAELAAWITEKENMMIGDEVGEDLEQVEEMQKKFDDFQKVCHDPSPPHILRLFIHLNKLSWKLEYK